MYYLRLSRTVSMVSQGMSVLTNSIGPFENVNAAQAWFVKNANWLDAVGVTRVETEYMAQPI